MGLGIRFVEDIHVIPVFYPLDITTTDINTTHVKVSNAHRVTFLVYWGVITTDSIVVTVRETAQATTANAETIPYTYRMSGTSTTDTWDAITTADSDGIHITASQDGKIMMIDVDPAILTEGDNYLSVLLTTGGSMTECLVSVIAFLQPRYSGLNMVSTT